MVSRRNYAAITAVMAIIFFLFQFLNMAKDHCDTLYCIS